MAAPRRPTSRPQTRSEWAHCHPAADAIRSAGTAAERGYLIGLTGVGGGGGGGCQRACRSCFSFCRLSSISSRVVPDETFSVTVVHVFHGPLPAFCTL